LGFSEHWPLATDHLLHRLFIGAQSSGTLLQSHPGFDESLKPLQLSNKFELKADS
jgi:hypothetical protein